MPILGAVPDFLEQTSSEKVQEVEVDFEYDQTCIDQESLMYLYRDTRRRREIEMIRKEVDRLQRPLDILDIGADPFRPSGYAQRSSDLFRTYLGIEPSVPIVSRTKVTKKIGLIRSTGETMPLKKDRFDVVLCFSTLDHVVNPERVLQNVLHACRPGGMLVVDLKNNDAWFKRVYQSLPRKLTDRLHKTEDHHTYAFSPQSFQKLLRSVGFLDIQRVDLLYLTPFIKREGGQWIIRRLGRDNLSAKLQRFDSFLASFMSGMGANFVVTARKGNS